MAIHTDMNQVNVAVYDKVREYLRVDKKLGGLIKVIQTVYVHKIGRKINIIVPFIDEYDEVLINGCKFVPKEQE